MRTRAKKTIFGPVALKDPKFKLKETVDSKALGQWLRDVRRNAGVTLSELAERMDWKPQNVSRLESGGDKREPTISSVNLYLRMLGREVAVVAPKRGPKKVAGEEGVAERAAEENRE